MVHLEQGDAVLTEAANRDQTIAGSVRSDVLAALQLVDGAHKVVVCCVYVWCDVLQLIESVHKTGHVCVVCVRT